MGVGVSVAFPVIGLGLDASPMKAGFATAIAASESFKGALEGSLSAIAGPKIGGQLYRLGAMAASAFTSKGGIKGTISGWATKATEAWNGATYTGVGKAIGGFVRKAFVYAGQTVNAPGLMKGVFGTAGKVGGGLFSMAGKALSTLAMPVMALNQGAEFVGKIIRLFGEPFRQLMEFETVFSKLSAFGGMAGAATSLDKFRATAKATGITVTELASQVGPLIGAGFNFDEATSQVQGFARAAAVLGEGSLGAMVSAAASFRGETFASADGIKSLAATGLPIYAALSGVLSEIYGRQVSMAEATNLLTNGFVTSAQAASALDMAVNSKQMGQAIEAQAATLSGVWSKLKAQTSDYFAQAGNFWVHAFDVKTILSFAQGLLEGISQPIEVLGARWAAALDPNRLKESFTTAREMGLSFAQTMMDVAVTIGEYTVMAVNKIIDGLNLLGNVGAKVMDTLSPAEWGRSIAWGIHEATAGAANFFGQFSLPGFIGEGLTGKKLGDLIMGENTWVKGKKQDGTGWEGINKVDASGSFASARDWISNLFASAPGGKDREQLAQVNSQLAIATASATRFGQSISQSISNPIDELSKTFAQYEIVLWDLQRAGADAATIASFQAQATEGLAAKAGEAYGPLLQAQQALANVSKSAGSAVYGSQEYAKAVLSAMAPQSAVQDKQTLIVEALRNQTRIQQETLQTNRELLKVTSAMRGAPVAAIR